MNDSMDSSPKSEDMATALKLLKENPDQAKSLGIFIVVFMTFPFWFGGSVFFVMMLAKGELPMMYGWLAGLALLLLIMLSMYNKAMRLRMAVKAAYSQLDNDFQRRAELVPNLVEIVKDSIGYEEETLTKLVAQRQQGQVSIGERVRMENQMTRGIQSMMAQVEAYPTLQANSSMNTLKSELAETETRIAQKRDSISTAIQNYNSYVCSIPAMFVVQSIGFREMEQIGLGDNPDARKSIKVDVR